MVDDGTRTIDGGTLIVTSGTHTVNGGTLTVASGTRIVDNSTLTVGGGTQTSDDQHRLGNTVASTSRSRRHQAKEHPHVCWHKAKI
jgi:hypothetical protein